MTTDVLVSALFPGAEAVSDSLTLWDKARAALAMLGDYRRRREALYDQIAELDVSICSIEQSYRKLLDAAVDHELSLAKGN